MQIGRFFSNIVGRPREEIKRPVMKTPADSQIESLKISLIARVGELCLLNSKKLEDWKSICTDFNQDENRIEIQIRF